MFVTSHGGLALVYYAIDVSFHSHGCDLLIRYVSCRGCIEHCPVECARDHCKQRLFVGDPRPKGRIKASGYAVCLTLS